MHAARGISIQRGLRVVGALEDVAATAVAEHAINLLAMPIAPGPASTPLPRSVLALLRASRAPILLYHATDAEVQPAVNPSNPSPKRLQGASRPKLANL